MSRMARNPWDANEIRAAVATRDRDHLRNRAEDAIERMPHADSKVREVCARFLATDNSSRMAETILTTTSPTYASAFIKVVRHEGSTAALTENERAALERAMAIGTGPAGGFAIPFQLDPAVILTANGSHNEIRKIARVVPVANDEWHGVSSSGVTGSWDGEAEEVSDDSPTLAQPTIKAHKGQMFVQASFEAIDDAGNLAHEVANMFAFEKDRMESVAFVTGSGTGQPKGIITALAGTAAEVSALSPATLTLQDIYAVDSALPARWAARASWLAHRAIYNKLRQFDSAGGSALWGQLAEGRKSELLGRPDYVAEAMTPTVTAGARPIVFGDFSNFVICEHVGGTRVEFVPNLFGPNGRPTGQRGWLAHFRVGADVVNPAAFRVVKA